MKGIAKSNAPYSFIAPTLILLILYSLFPIAIALVISFTNMDLTGLANYSAIQFVGFQNYFDVISDPTFVKAILNTLFYVVLGVPFVIIFSLTIALLINSGKSRMFNVFRVVYYTFRH